MKAEVCIEKCISPSLGTLYYLYINNDVFPIPEATYNDIKEFVFKDKPRDKKGRFVKR